MNNRIFNFSAGPGMLPLEVLDASAKALVDYQGQGVGIAEVSHRGKEFGAVLSEATELCKKLLNVPDTHEVLFLQGGATQLFSVVPMNILGDGVADYVVGGNWSKKAASEAKKAYGERVRVIGSSAETNFDRPAVGWSADDEASYLHICSNETVHGHRFVEWPDHPTLVVDASSEMMSRPHPVDRAGIVYAGAQKNLGPAGVVLTIVRKDLFEREPEGLPNIFSFSAHAKAGSCQNTPPTFGVYMLLETFRWLDRTGGLSAMEKRNAEKARIVYSAIDGSGGFYKGTVADKDARSHMNVTFTLPTEDLTKKFLSEATAKGLVALKGYRTVGGVRASIYNAMPLEGCTALSEHMATFAQSNG